MSHSDDEVRDEDSSLSDAESVQETPGPSRASPSTLIDNSPDKKVRAILYGLRRSGNYRAFSAPSNTTTREDARLEAERGRTGAGSGTGMVAKVCSTKYCPPFILIYLNLRVVLKATSLVESKSPHE